MHRTHRRDCLMIIVSRERPHTLRNRLQTKMGSASFCHGSTTRDFPCRAAKNHKASCDWYKQSKAASRGTRTTQQRSGSLLLEIAVFVSIYSSKKIIKGTAGFILHSKPFEAALDRKSQHRPVNGTPDCVLRLFFAPAGPYPLCISDL